MGNTGSEVATAPLALIIEDEPFFSQILERVLGRLGVASRVAVDGDAARAALRSTSFDVILIDLRLPGQDGPCLVEEIQGNADLVSRSIVVTAFPTVANMFTDLPIVEKTRVADITNHVRRILGSRTPPLAS